MYPTTNNDRGANKLSIASGDDSKDSFTEENLGLKVKPLERN